MKKFLTALFFVCLLAPNAQAFTVTEEVQVVPPAVSVKPSPPSITKKTVNELLTASRKKIEATIEKKNSAVAGAFNALGNKISAQKVATDNLGVKIESLKTAINGQGTAATDNGVKLDALHRNLFEKDGMIQTLKTSVWEAAKEADRSTTAWMGWMTAWIILVVVLVGVVSTLFLGRSFRGVREAVVAVGTKVDAVQNAVEDVPAKTAFAVKRLDPMTIDFTCKTGEHIIFNPLIVNAAEGERYLTAYVPKSVTGPVPADPANIVRVPAEDKTGARKTSMAAIENHFEKVANAAAVPYPVTDQEKNQSALINHLRNTGEMKVS